MTLFEIAKRGFRRYGLTGSLRRALAIARRSAVRVPYLCERHIWYRLDLASERRRMTLPAGLELVRVGADGLSALAETETVGLLDARRWLASGADLWKIREGKHAVFSCWIFRHRTPVLAAPGGWLDLPEGTVSLEDSVTIPSHRGRGIAPGAYSGIADVLAREGVTTIITKVEEKNVPSRRAVEKFGFRTVADMRLVRIWLRPHVEVKVQAGEGESLFLIERLAR